MPTLSTTDIKTRPPFSTLFPVDNCVWEAIKESMELTGFDGSKPLNVWRQENILLDGHTRLSAAKAASVDVEVFYHDFETEDAALEYAIANQRNRRNLTDGDLLRCIQALDTRKSEGRPEKTSSSELVFSGASRERTAELVGTSPVKVQKARTLLDHASTETLVAVEQGGMSINKAYNETQQRRREQKQAEAEDLEMVAPPRANSVIQLLPPVATRGLHIPGAEDLAAIRGESKATFNQTNENVEWARWTWNPVTGCLHGCDYCYARDIAARFYEQGFAPTFIPERLTAPHNTRLPEKATPDTSWRNVFVCSMADLWGKWVPTEIIDLILAEVKAAPQWNFLFLTKFPARYEEFAGRIPANAWIGTSVDKQHAVHRAEKAFRKVADAGHAGVRWLSCEPMLEPLEFSALDMFNWVVMGGASSSTQTAAFVPPFDWVVGLHNQARAARCKVYQKTNLFSSAKPETVAPLLTNRLREYPWE